MNRSRRPSRAVRRIAVRRFRRALRLEFSEDRHLLAANLQAAADQAADGYVCPLETPPPSNFTRLVPSQHGQVFEIFQDREEDRALWIKSKPQPPTGQVERLAAPALRGEAELLPARLFDPVRVADQFLAEFGSALGIRDPQAQLVPQIVTVDELGMTHLRYRQFHEGVAVYGSEILVHLGADGQISSANGYGVILSEIDMTPTLSSEAASELALLDFGDQYPHLATPPEQLSSTLYVFDPASCSTTGRAAPTWCGQPSWPRSSCQVPTC